MPWAHLFLSLSTATILFQAINSHPDYQNSFQSDRMFTQSLSYTDTKVVFLKLLLCFPLASYPISRNWVVLHKRLVIAGTQLQLKSPHMHAADVSPCQHSVRGWLTYVFLVKNFFYYANEESKQSLTERHFILVLSFTRGALEQIILFFWASVLSINENVRLDDLWFHSAQSLINCFSVCCSSLSHGLCWPIWPTASLPLGLLLHRYKDKRTRQITS